MTNKLWLTMLALAALHGCASMDKSQCLTADWRTIGFEDGASGKPETAIGTYRQDCADHGIAPDLNAYRLGHRQGSENFCTQRNGFNVGLRGASYQGSCTADLAEQFLSGYRDGQQLYGLQQAVNNARSAIDRQHRQISNVEKQIAIHTELLVADGLVRDERIRLLNEIEALKAEHFDLINRLPELEDQLQYAEQQLQQGEQRFTSYR
ncbi:DUF2799 domain-containing protein [Arsukibacterium sp.]|uniref:DUF2799 domain-containing protein n=1 Tax=Arsukibacterium sp. TaxID=1977258 RepID=UPI00299D7E49|nr:DUF2799 domain-containing protein [Arsukibacterium sp.]MDX1539162.1 DUF2799 domain-containing protein [Arsukibacterium sp.]